MSFIFSNEMFDILYKKLVCKQSLSLSLSLSLALIQIKNTLVLRNDILFHKLNTINQKKL